MNLKNKCIAAMLLLFSSGVIAQSTISSPYSRFGYGVLTENVLSQGQGLGYAGIGLRTGNHLNFINPASFSAIDSSHFLFEVGLSSRFNYFSLNGEKTNNSNTSMDYLAAGFPITRWWGMGVTLMPFSKIGYSYVEDGLLPDSSKTTSYYIGTGGFNKVVIGQSFNVCKQLSVGLNSAFIFGEAEFSSINNVASDAFFDPTTKYSWYNVHGFNFEAGLQYTLPVGKEKSMVFGVLYAPKQKLNYTKTALTTTSSSSDTVEYVDGEKYKNDMPQKIGAGFSYSEKDKLIFVADVSYQSWKNASVFTTESSYFKDAKKVNLGFEYLPNKYASRGYFNRVRYRVGLRYQDSYLTLPTTLSSEKNPVTEAAINVGFGLPLKLSANNINITLEYGTKGTKSKNLIKENFFVINLNFTFNENWFYKQKIQ